MAAATEHRTRPAAVAGMFYPGERAELAQCVKALLRTAPQPPAESPVPKAIIAPHAGYIYSGAIAASVYAHVAPARARVTRVVLLGPTHRVPVRGLALPDVDALATPLGTVGVDRDAVENLRGLAQVVQSAAAHAMEHSLEVHLPFLQTLFDSFRVVPLAVGMAEPEEVAAVIDALWGGPETLVVVSSDLSHYLPHREAQAIDRRTADAILDLPTEISHEQACGATPVAGLALVARRRNLTRRLIDLRNSGDTAGDKSRVVGYGAFAFYE